MAKNPFLDAAKKKLDEQQSKVDAVQQHRDDLAALTKAQYNFFEAHLRPLVEQLKALPKKNNRAFTVTRNGVMNSDADPKMVLALEYTGGVHKKNIDRGGRVRGPGLSDSITMVIDKFIDENNFSLRIIRQDSYVSEDDKRHKAFTVTSVDTMLGVLGDFVASVAPDRIAELGAPAVKEEKKNDTTDFAKGMWDTVGDMLNDDPKETPKTPRKPPARGRRR